MRAIISAAVASHAIGAAPLLAQDGDMAFGTPEDVAYAELLWAYMAAERLVGPNMVRSLPYVGTEPHGMMLAGRVAKGMDEGCIACRQGAADDMVFTSDHLIAS